MNELYNLADMLRTLDVEKNDKETIKEVLDFIAEKLENIGDELNGKNE